ncbi:MAG: gliding motility lipoprotein GldH [Bacteroidetes bacterium]|nr:MAG: gliding motility lipoprotein GldH [Bacteroidota bacterium]
MPTTAEIITTAEGVRKSNLAVVKKTAVILIALVAMLMQSCNSNTVYDQNLFLPEDGWHYKNRAAFDIEITDTTHYHNFFVNLRITPDYEYSNLYVLVYAKSPTGDSTMTREELKLAETDGRWTGKGSASIITYRIPIAEKFVPKKTGVYHFEIEQNMRTNTLKDVVNIGMAVEKGDVVF